MTYDEIKSEISSFSLNLDIKKFKENAFFFGINNDEKKYNELIQSFDNIYQDLTSKLKELEEKISTFKDNSKHRLERDKEENRQEIKELEDRLNIENEEIKELNNNLSLLKKRYYPLKQLILFERTKSKKTEQENIQENLKTLSHTLYEDTVQIAKDFLKVEDELTNIELKIYEKNEPEIKRRVSFLQKKIDTRQIELDIIISRINKMLNVGLTFTTTRFLILVGYMGVVALGWYIGEIIYAGGFLPESFISQIVKLLSDSFAQLKDAFGVFWSFIIMVFGPLLIIVLVISLYFGIGWVIHKWISRAKNAAPIQYKMNPKFSEILFNDEYVINQRYRKKLIQIPEIYFYFIIPLIVSYIVGVFLKPDALSDLTMPWESIVFTYLGVTVCLISTALSILYISNLVEKPKNDEAKEKKNNKIISTLELRVITFLFIVLLGFSFVYTPLNLDETVKQPLGIRNLLLIALLISYSFCYAYGVIYYGIFKKQADLNNEIFFFENEIQKIKALPFIDNFRSTTAGFLDKIKKAYNIWYTKFSDVEDMLIDRPYRNRLSIIFKKEKEQQPEEKLYDSFLLIPDDIKNNKEKVKEILEISTEIRNLIDEIDELKKKIDETKDSINQKKSQMSEIEDKESIKNISDLSHIMFEKKSELDSYLRNAKSEVSISYSTGKLLN